MLPGEQEFETFPGKECRCGVLVVRMYISVFRFEKYRDIHIAVFYVLLFLCIVYYIPYVE